LFAFRQVRRSARLEAAAEQQARVRELERQLFHSERLASVGRLAAGLAHEINNPLEGMTNYLSMLREDLEAGRAEDARELVPPLSEGLGRVAGILRQVLAFADPGRTPKSRLDLARVVGRTAEFVRANPAYRGVRIGVALPAEPLPVVGNEVTLGQLVLNLLVNACQAQPDHGEVEVTARRAGDRAEVTVADRGRGLPPEVRERLFEPFVSTRGSTGLGLAVCHGIAEDHRGRLAAEDRPGGGTVFRFELPLAEEGGESASPAQPGRARTAAPTDRKPSAREGVVKSGGAPPAPPERPARTGMEGR
jgi:signal transduction histidine kinase